ncbi:MAG: hypothetical protein VB101_03920 [Rhodospirillaceae bacterium]|nr:hypothetical protein [Rhodospirillaceae bacterium]
MTAFRPFGLDLTGAWRQGGIAVAAIAAAAILATLAAGFMAMAGYIALTRRFDAEIAALIVAGALLVLALLAVLIVPYATKRARREVGTALSSNAILALVPVAVSLASKHTRIAAVIAAAGIGFWLARDAGKGEAVPTRMGPAPEDRAG